MNIAVTSLNKITNDTFSQCEYTNTFIRSFERFGNVKFVDIDHADVVIIITTYLGWSFEFNIEESELISKLNKPIVVIDYTEYGAFQLHNRNNEYNLYGYKLEFNDLNNVNTFVIHEFLLNNQNNICCYFKRELSNAIDLKKVPFPVFPIEFVADGYTMDNLIPDSHDEYYKRNCIYNFVWGRTNICRVHLYGAFLLNIEKFCCAIATSKTQYDFKIKNEKLITLINAEWYERFDLHELNFNSMMVVDLYGAGQKCFRNVESTKNSLSVKQDPNKLIYTYKWVDGENCISLPVNDDFKLDIDKSIDIMLEYRNDKHHLLYEMYLNSIETNQKYSLPLYIKNHIIRNIQNTI
jgi:hypothetical protein